MKLLTATLAAAGLLLAGFALPAVAMDDMQDDGMMHKEKKMMQDDDMKESDKMMKDHEMNDSMDDSMEESDKMMKPEKMMDDHGMKKH